MNRRRFLIASGAATLAGAPAPSPVTVLYGDRSVKLEKIRPDSKDLWVRSADLPRINEFEVKPQGACRADVCVPISKGMMRGPYFNLTAFAQKVGQAVVADSAAAVWSFGEVPALNGAYL